MRTDLATTLNDRFGPWGAPRPSISIYFNALAPLSSLLRYEMAVRDDPYRLFAARTDMRGRTILDDFTETSGS